MSGCLKSCIFTETFTVFAAASICLQSFPLSASMRLISLSFPCRRFAKEEASPGVQTVQPRHPGLPGLQRLHHRDARWSQSKRTPPPRPGCSDRR